MLRELRVKRFAVIEEVTVPFAPGLNVLTGETGAGKSILIDAILLLLGARAQSDLIRSDSESATVEAIFDIDPGGGIPRIPEAPPPRVALRARFAGAEAAREAVGALVSRWEQGRAELERLATAERDRARKEDLHRFQLSEIH